MKYSFFQEFSRFFFKNKNTFTIRRYTFFMIHILFFKLTFLIDSINSLKFCKSFDIIFIIFVQYNY